MVSNVVYDIYAGNITNKPASVIIEKSGHAYVTIYDSKSQTISDFSFALYNETTGFVASSVTDEEGTAFFNVPEGDYSLILTSGYNLRNGVKINILQGQDVSVTAIVEEVPFVLTPPMGAIPLTVECYANTNGFKNITKCLWDFDNDGTWDMEGFTVTNVYANVSVYDVSLKMVSSDGSERIFTETEAVDAWDKDHVELVDGALVLNQYSGYTISEIGEDYMILTMNEMYLPLGLDEGMCVINPSDILTPYEIVSFDELDEKTLRLEVKKTILANAYKVLRTSSLNKSLFDDILDGYNGSAKMTYGHHLKWSSDDNRAHVDVAIEGTLEFIIDYNKNHGLNFVMCHDSFTVGGIEIGLDINKPWSDKYDLTPNPHKYKRTKRLKKYRKELPVVDKQILVGYLPLRIEGYGFFEFELNGSVNFSHSGKNQIEWNSRKGWKRDDVIRTKNINLNGKGTASVGVALECGIGIGRAIKKKGKYEDYGGNILDATVKLGLQAGLEYDWNSNESIPDTFDFNAGQFGAFETKFAHIKWAGFEYYLASAEIEFKKDYYSYSWETPIPDFSVEYDKSLATSCYNYIDVDFASTTEFDTNKTAFVSREWLLGNLCFSSDSKISHRFYCNPDDKVWYTVYLYEKYKPTGLISKWIPFQRKSWKKEILIQGHSSDEPVKVKELARDRGGIVARSFDPNEMAGPLGFGDPDTERFVVPGQWMTYTIYFENKSDATAAAQEVTVSNPLSEYLDWDTFEMLDIAFNNQVDMGLSGKSSGVSEVVMNGANTLVRTELTLDKINGMANWYLRIVDPMTSTCWPDDPVAGFLPPNDETHRGEGHLTYRIKVREDAKPNAKITNSASIVFDYNEPIETDPAWWNTIKWDMGDDDVIDIITSVPDSEANASGDFVYDGNPKKLNVVITKKNASGDTVLVEGVDYDCTYYDNINASTTNNIPRVKITAKGDYYGEKTIEFDIKPRPVKLTSASQTWNYDAAVHSAKNVTAEGFVNGQGAKYSDFASIVNVGSRDNTFKYTLNSGTLASNYDIHIVNGKLKVTASLKIVFNANGGTGSMAAQIIPANTTTKLRANAFKRSGYTFAGWAKSKTGSVAYANAASVKNLPSSGTLTLYAVWKANYKVAFNANGGKGSMSTQSLTYDTAAKLSANAFTRSGYTFIGWAKTKNGAVAYKNAQAVKNLRNTSGTITLYAVWAKTKYKVAFYANGGKGTMTAQTMTYNKAAYLKKNAFKRTDYTFAGWAKTKTGAVVYKNAQAVKNLTTTGATVKLYAVWKPITYKIAFYANGGKGTMSAQTIPVNKAAYLKKNAFKRTGYTFQGWAKSVALAKKGKVSYKNRQAVKNLLKKSGTVKLIAVWKPITYKVAFYPNGGSGKAVAQSMTYNKAAYLKKNAFKRSGYIFIGWAKTKNGAVAYKNAQAVKNLRSTKGTIKLYAVWAKTKYKVAFYANGGKGTMTAQTMTYNKAAYLKKNAFKRTGYTFAGWAKTRTGSVVYKNGKAVKNLTKTGGTVKLYAVWKPIKK